MGNSRGENGSGTALSERNTIQNRIFLQKGTKKPAACAAGRENRYYQGTGNDFGLSGVEAISLAWEMKKELSFPDGMGVVSRTKSEETTLPFFFRMTDTRVRLQVYLLRLRTVPEMTV